MTLRDLYKGDLYREAVSVGHLLYRVHMAKSKLDAGEDIPQEDRPVMGPDGPSYWMVRHAARKTAEAMLAEAQLAGVTPEQYEALRKTAAEVAYD